MMGTVVMVVDADEMNEVGLFAPLRRVAFRGVLTLYGQVRT